MLTTTTLLPCFAPISPPNHFGVSPTAAQIHRRLFVAVPLSHLVTFAGPLGGCSATSSRAPGTLAPLPASAAASVRPASTPVVFPCSVAAPDPTVSFGATPFSSPPYRLGRRSSSARFRRCAGGTSPRDMVVGGARPLPLRWTVGSGSSGPDHVVNPRSTGRRVSHTCALRGSHVSATCVLTGQPWRFCTKAPLFYGNQPAVQNFTQ